VKKAMPEMTIALAMAYFGEEVLVVSSPAGRGVNARLDYRVLTQIQNDLRRKFASRVPHEDFPEFLKYSMNCLATKCKNLRMKHKDQLTQKKMTLLYF